MVRQERRHCGERLLVVALTGEQRNRLLLLEQNIQTHPLTIVGGGGGGGAGSGAATLFPRVVAFFLTLFP